MEHHLQRSLPRYPGIRRVPSLPPHQTMSLPCLGGGGGGRSHPLGLRKSRLLNWNDPSFYSTPVPQPALLRLFRCVCPLASRDQLALGVAQLLGDSWIESREDRASVGPFKGLRDVVVAGKGRDSEEAEPAAVQASLGISG